MFVCLFVCLFACRNTLQVTCVAPLKHSRPNCQTEMARKCNNIPVPLHSVPV